MIVRRLNEISESDKCIKSSTFESRRFLLRSDKMGFTLTDTLIYPNTSTEICYINHLEACYCIEGTGSILLTTGETIELSPGTMYALDQHERHTILAKTALRLICVFNPPLNGAEIHNKQGAYDL